MTFVWNLTTTCAGSYSALDIIPLPDGTTPENISSIRMNMSSVFRTQGVLRIECLHSLEPLVARPSQIDELLKGVFRGIVEGSYYKTL